MCIRDRVHSVIIRFNRFPLRNQNKGAVEIDGAVRTESLLDSDCDGDGDAAVAKRNESLWAFTSDGNDTEVERVVGRPRVGGRRKVGPVGGYP